MIHILIPCESRSRSKTASMVDDRILVVSSTWTRVGHFGDNVDLESFRKEDNIYACDHCHFSTKNKSNLKAHRNAKHLGVKHPCKQCGYKVSYSNHLRQHKRVKHEGVHFPCELCLFSTSQKSKLKLHMHEKHAGSLDFSQNHVLLSLEALNSHNFRHQSTQGSGQVSVNLDSSSGSNMSYWTVLGFQNYEYLPLMF